MPNAAQSQRFAILCLATSALLFSLMGVCIRYASYTVDNYSIVFFRNAVGLLLFLPLVTQQGLRFIKTEKLWMHTWRALCGLVAMYGFFYAIAHLKLSNAMVFTYSSPVFIPLIAWLFLKEKITKKMLFCAFIGFVGVLLVAKPNQGLINTLALVGIASSLLAAMAFVTVRALTQTEPPARIVFYFCGIGTLVSAVPMFWFWQPYTQNEWLLLIAVGALANISQMFMSHAYRLAPAAQIGPVNYIAIIFAGIWGYFCWGETPDMLSICGFIIILMAIVINSPWWTVLQLKFVPWGFRKK